MKCNLYRHYDASDRLLYVGISLDAVSRLAQHMARSPWAAEIARVEIQVLPTREEAIAAERKAIAEERPQFNILHVRGEDARLAFPPEFDKSYYDDHGLPHLVATFEDSYGRKVDAEFVMDEGHEVILSPRNGASVSLDFAARERLDILGGLARNWAKTFEETDQYARLGEGFTL